MAPALHRTRSRLPAPRCLWGFFLPPPPLSSGGRSSVEQGGISQGSPRAALPAPLPSLAANPPHTRPRSLRAGTKPFKAALYIPPQLPAQPLLQRSPGEDAYSSAPKGPHCCQLVTGRHRDSRLTAPAKQEKWTQWGARGPALFLSPPPASFSPQEIPFSARLFKPPPQSPCRGMHVGGCAAPRDAKRAVKGAPGTADLPTWGVINISVCFYLPRLHPGLQLQIPPSLSSPG